MVLVIGEECSQKREKEKNSRKQCRAVRMTIKMDEWRREWAADTCLPKAARAFARGSTTFQDSWQVA
jgi:hypothetical protein